MGLYAQAHDGIERYLYKWGFSFPLARQLLCTQLLLTGCALAIAVIALPFSLWPIGFAAGVALSTWSLWSVSRIAQAFIGIQFSALLAARLFIGLTARLLLTGLILFALIIVLKVPVIALLIGLSATAVGITAWGITRFTRKPAKEA